jgi:hypothetical protein
MGSHDLTLACAARISPFKWYSLHFDLHDNDCTSMNLPARLSFKMAHISLYQIQTDSISKELVTPISVLGLETSLHFLLSYFFKNSLYAQTASAIQWSEFLATDPKVRVRFPTLPDFLRSSGSGMGSTQPRKYD